MHRGMHHQISVRYFLVFDIQHGCDKFPGTSFGMFVQQDMYKFIWKSSDQYSEIIDSPKCMLQFSRQNSLILCKQLVLIMMKMCANFQGKLRSRFREIVMLEFTYFQFSRYFILFEVLHETGLYDFAINRYVVAVYHQ